MGRVWVGREKSESEAEIKEEKTITIDNNNNSSLLSFRSVEGCGTCKSCIIMIVMPA